MPAETVYQRFMRRGDYTIGVMLLLIGVLLLAALPSTWNDYHTLHAATSQHLTATVTKTLRDCGRGGCHWNSYGTYTINGITETNRLVLAQSRFENWHPQSILVDPSHPGDPVNITDNPGAGLWFFPAFSLLLLTCGVYQCRTTRRRHRVLQEQAPPLLAPDPTMPRADESDPDSV